jgi:CubicO group peptidase (beta-lactamase class C family)
MALATSETVGGLGALELVNPHLGGGGLTRHHAVVPAAPAPSGRRELPTALRPLTVAIAGAGRWSGLPEFLATVHATSLLVVVDGTVVHEWYADGLGPTDLFLGASMTKSVLACLVGRAVDAGVLGLDEPVTAHVPELAGSGYAGVTVRQVASMTSGLDWVEDHRDPTSAASRLREVFAGGTGGSRDLLRSLAPRSVPGSRHAYCTADSQVLDWVRERATGEDHVTALGRLWADLGCGSDAVVGLDAAPELGGVAMAGGALAATTRDWARVGLLQATGEGDRGPLISAGWREVSSRPAAPFLRPGRLASTLTTHAGFGLHWWPLDDAGRRVMADGSRGQLLHVDRDSGTVVVLTARWPYDEATDRQCRDLAYLALPAVARAASGQPGLDDQPQLDDQQRVGADA